MKNPAGTVASREAKLSLILPIEITAQPGARELVVGDRLELRIGASGSPVIEYEWFKDGAALEGEVSETLVVESVQVAETGNYHATAKNEAGSVTSETAKVDVYAPLAWVTKPTAARAISGEAAEFRVEVSGSQPIEYEWRFNSQVIEGATGPVLTVANASKANEGSYQVVMKNPAGSVVSEEVKLTVVQPVAVSYTHLRAHET